MIQVTLHNRIKVRPGSPLTLIPRQRAGMHAQLVAYDVTTSDGFNAGNNPDQTADANPSSIGFRWYAGNLTIDEKGGVTGQPVEFGAIGLSPSDPFNQGPHGLFGASTVVVWRPWLSGSTWLAARLDIYSSGPGHRHPEGRDAVPRVRPGNTR